MKRRLFILDEVQECERAVSSLKYFCTDAPERAVCAAGKYGCPYVVKVSQKNFGFENGVLNVPLYAAGLLAEVLGTPDGAWR